MSTATALLILLMAAPLVYGVDHIVGGNAGWSTVVNYFVWAAAQNFTVNDTLVFNYDTKYSVDKVNQTDYDACNSSHPLGSYVGGSTVITLSNAGEMYFICPTPGACAQGMKLAVNVSSDGSAALANLMLGVLLVVATMLAYMG